MRLYEGPAETPSNRSETESDVITGLEAGVLGSWSATRWHYTPKDHAHSAIDVVCDLRATITLSLTVNRYVLTWAIPGGPGGSRGGEWTMRENQIAFAPEGTGRIESFEVRRRPDLLSLRSETSSWDFNSDGTEEPAGFIAVLVRI